MTCPSKVDRLRSQATGWVVRNLKDYGNTLVPDEVIKSLTPEVTARLLTIIIGEEVKVYKAKTGFWLATR